MKERPLSELLQVASESERLAQAQADLNRRAGGMLRAARLDAGISQSDFAAQAGKNQAYLSLVENGKKTISSRTIRNLTDVLDSMIKEKK